MFIMASELEVLLLPGASTHAHARHSNIISLIVFSAAKTPNIAANDRLIVYCAAISPVESNKPKR
ncbi:hypothetical protein PaeBR_19175 [Paenibacillus sp. BR2-3]|uniref:hypothetical protein n=1 Tax=Paenibacillus sp. BR2-3 TaxID=3048494 RepID=UPI0039776BA0